MLFHNTAVVSRSFRMQTRRQLTAPPKRQPVDSAMTGMRAQWQGWLETLSGIRQWKLRLQLAGRTGSDHKPDQDCNEIERMKHYNYIDPMRTDYLSVPPRS